MSARSYLIVILMIVPGDASKMTSTSPLDVKSVTYGDDTKSGCPYDYVRIPGGSEDGNTHTARERYCGQALGFCRVQVAADHNISTDANL